MAKFMKAEAPQYPLYLEAVVNFDDAVVDASNGASVDLAGTAVDVPFEITGAVPYGASVVGGDVVVETAWNGVGTGTATLKIGDATTADRYTGSAVDLETAARTALTITGYKYTSATPLQGTVTITAGQAAPTQGKVRVRIALMVDGRQNENLM